MPSRLLLLTCSAFFLTIALPSNQRRAETATSDKATSGELDPESKRLLKRLKNGPSSPEWDAALRALKLKGDTAWANANKVLVSLQAQYSLQMRRIVTKINALAANASPSKAALSCLLKWETDKKAATAWILNPVKFPPPQVSPPTGPCKGYYKAKKLGDAAMRSFKKLLPHMRPPIRSFLALTEKKAKVLSSGYKSARSKLGRIQENLNSAQGSTAPLPTDSAALYLALACGRLEETARIYHRLTSNWTKVCAFYAWAELVMKANRQDPCGMKRPAAGTIELINQCRMSLGILPLLHNSKLVQMAEKHTEEMNKYGYLGHVSPVPANRDIVKRARNVGYGASVTECCTSGGPGKGAVDLWKWDGGHYRGMVSPAWTEVGLSSRAPVTLNPGAGNGERFWRIKY